MERFVLSGEKSRGTAGLVLTLVFLFVFLFLAALYESWLVPVAVLLSLPVAALGAYLGILGFGLENDIYFQIGLVTLIGLAAKNAILIVEFAKMEVDKGVDVVVAAKNAAMLRFRPILMTSLAFVLGMLPLSWPRTGCGQPPFDRDRCVLRYDCSHYHRNSIGTFLLCNGL